MVATLSHPTLEWSSLQDVFYRKSEIYQLSWGIDNLSDYIVASAKNGGFLALIRDPNKLVSVGRAALLKPKINVYTSAGQLIESIPWDASDKIVTLGFTDQEQLVVVLDEGVVRIYSLLSPCPASPPSTAHLESSSHFNRPIEATPTCYYTQHSLAQEATDTGVIDAKLWGEGLVVLTGGGRYVEWRFPGRKTADEEGGFNEAEQDPASQPRVLPSLSLPTSTSSSQSKTTTPFSWDLLPPIVSRSGLLEVFISPYSSNTVYTLEAGSGSTDMRLSRGPFAAIRPSPNGKLLALLTADNKLWVVSSDFQRSLSEFDITHCAPFQAAQEAAQRGSPQGLRGTGVRQVEWCGNNTVALAWETEVLMVGPFGDSLSYPYSDPIHLISEVDGMRIISAAKLEFLQKVPECSSQIFLPGSTHAAAILFDSSEQFAKKSAKADEGIRAIKKDLVTAVDTCFRAAGYEWEVAWQRRLLRAASFGKSFLDLYDPTQFVGMAKTLRVLNAARRYDVGVPITYEQYSPQVLISRLTLRNHHLLCLRIASYLDMCPDAILKHWARAKIARSRPAVGALAQAATGGGGAKQDDEICEAIVAKFEMQPAASFAEIAKTAWNAGRARLATKLLDHEPRAVDQVPLLLSMHQDKLALVKALESGDADLVYHVILRLKSQLSRGDFFRIIQAPIADATAPGQTADSTSTSPAPSSHLYLASKLLEAYARSEDRELLRDFYFQDDRRTESAVLSLQEARLEPEVGEKVFKIKEAMQLFGEDKERSLESKLCEEEAKLLGFQQALEKETGGRSSFVGLSVNDTIRECLIKNMTKKADKIRSDWKVPDKRFWFIKMSSLVATRDFDGLWAFAGSKKSPVGYTPFVSTLLKEGHQREAQRYVAKCTTDKADRAKLNSLLQRLPSHIALPLADELGE